MHFNRIPFHLKSLLAKCLCRGGIKRVPCLPPLNPLPLPLNRIDIEHKPMAEQLQSPLLRKLPLELRECIYDAAMGGRWIVMKVVEPVSIPGKQGQSVVRSTCYVNAEKQEDIFADDMDGPAIEAKITIALLLACRQVYIEALPILHQRNTFCFPAEHFGILFFSSLGHTCLLSIRRLSLYVPYQYGLSYHFDTPWTWKTVFPILKEMRIQSLELGFGNNTVAGSGPFKDSDAVLKTAWGHSVLEIRGLRRFRLSLNFDDEVPPTRGEEIEQRFQQLMIGPDADERYTKFLEEWETSWKV